MRTSGTEIAHFYANEPRSKKKKKVHFTQR